MGGCQIGVGPSRHGGPRDSVGAGSGIVLTCLCLRNPVGTGPGVSRTG